MVRSIVLAAVSSVALGSVAVAADLPSTKGPPVYAPPPAVFSWTGAYVGGQVGYEWGQTSFSVFNPFTGTFTGGFPGYTERGIVGGGHVGYNYQISQFVIGVEGDVNGAGYNGSELIGVTSLGERIAVDGSIRGRVGVAFDRLLIYGTGGGAFGSIRESVVTPVTSDARTTGRVGWTVGGGVEYAIDNNWSVRGEYRYTDYGRYSLTYTNAPVTLRYHATDNRVQAGFSYRFDMFEPPAPVVAKY